VACGLWAPRPRPPTPAPPPAPALLIAAPPAGAQSARAPARAPAARPGAQGRGLGSLVASSSSASRRAKRTGPSARSSCAPWRAGAGFRISGRQQQLRQQARKAHGPQRALQLPALARRGGGRALEGCGLGRAPTRGLLRPETRQRWRRSRRLRRMRRHCQAGSRMRGAAAVRAWPRARAWG